MKRAPEWATRQWLTWGLCAAGLLLVDIALVRYTSYADRRILSRWSPLHFSLIVPVTLAFLLSAYRCARARMTNGSRRMGGAALVAALGFLMWALSLAFDTLSDPDAGGRISDLRVFSSTSPFPLLIEWMALALGLVAMTAWLWSLVSGRLARNLLTSLVSLGVTLLLFEAVFRVLAVVTPQTQGFPTRAQVLWTQRYVRLNSLGYRDVEPLPTPPNGRTRIILVGDSVGHGFGIEHVRHRVSERVQDALNQGPGPGGQRFEVMTAARPDTHTLDQIAALPRVLAFRPQYVLLLYVFNDIEHVSRPRRSVVSDPGSVAARLHPLRLLVLNSALAEQVFVRVSRSAAGAWAPVRDPYMDDRILDEHLRALERFFEMCREAGNEARLVPFDLRVLLGPESRRRYQRLVLGAEARGIPVWSLEHAFDGHPYSTLIVNHLDHHPNELAHQLAARVIVDRFHAELERATLSTDRLNPDRGAWRVEATVP